MELTLWKHLGSVRETVLDRVRAFLFRALIPRVKFSAHSSAEINKLVIMLSALNADGELELRNCHVTKPLYAALYEREVTCTNVASPAYRSYPSSPKGKVRGYR
jgi:hypothetical protein